MTAGWQKDGKAYRPATPDEIKAMQALPGAPHVMFGCVCGRLSWHAKNIALSDRGGYNGTRNIFYSGDGPECSCPGSSLMCIVVDDAAAE